MDKRLNVVPDSLGPETGVNWCLLVLNQPDLQGKKGRGRPRKILLSWLLKTKEGNLDNAYYNRTGTRQIKVASMKM